jgi:hypothetical protein
LQIFTDFATPYFSYIIKGMDTLNETKASKIFSGLNDRQRQAVEVGLCRGWSRAGFGFGRSWIWENQSSDPPHRLPYSYQAISSRKYSGFNFYQQGR